MVLGSLFSKETTVGIDIGSSSIKAVEIEPNAHGWELVNAAVTPTPNESIKDGTIVNIPEVASAVKKLLKDAGIKASGAICAVSGSQVIVRQVQIQKMAEAMLRKSIKYEASKYISASVEDSVVEFEILGDGDEAGQMNVMLVAAPREMIDNRVSIMEMAGLEPLVIDIEAFAIIRSLVDFSASDKYVGRTVAIIDMGASHTDVNIVSNGEFALTRNIPIAGNSFTNAIKSLSGVSFDEAQQIKHEMTNEHSLDELCEVECDSKNWKVVQPLLDELIREIKRSVHYYQSQFPEGSMDAAVSQIILTGGSARLRGMDKYIASKLNIPAEVANVFNQSAVDTDKVPEEFLNSHGVVMAVCAGLGLKEYASDTCSKAA